MIIKDAKFLSQINWGFIIVDEGHRLKNFEAKLITEIKKYNSNNRLILTGTPLHVSITLSGTTCRINRRTVFLEQSRRVVVSSQFHPPRSIHRLGFLPRMV